MPARFARSWRPVPTRGIFVTEESESLADEEQPPRDGKSVPPEGKNDLGNRTMQIDAYVDELVDAGVDVPSDAVLAEVLADGIGSPAVPQVSLPPPLPPKKPSKLLISLGVVVVFVAIGAGVYVGSLLLAGPPPAAVAHPSPQPGDDGNATFVPIELDEVVVGAEHEDTPTQEGETDEPQAPAP